MKKEYIKPEIEISVFDTEDIITVSSASSMTDGGELSDTNADASYNDLF